MKKISVIIPIFNVNNYLLDCLESVNRQTYKNYEVILIDDGSTDGSSIIAKRYALEHNNFKYYYEENKGLSSARNHGIKIAQGDYILFLDSDDYIDPNTLEKLDNILEKDDFDFIIFGGEYDFYQGDMLIKSIPCGNKISEKAKAGQYLYCDLRNSNSYFTGAPFQIIKRKFLEKHNIRFYEGILHEDHLYTFEIFMYAKKCCAIDAKLYHYRVRSDSITHSYKPSIDRFIGFAITYIKMSEISKRIDFLSDVVRSNVMIHVEKVWNETIKYYVKSTKQDLKKHKSIIRKLIYIHFNAESFGIIYFYVLRLFHFPFCVISKCKRVM